MKKSFRKLICGLSGIVFCILMLFPMSAEAADSSGTMRIEQARINMPDIKVYYYPGNSASGDMTATLSDEKLTIVGSYPYSEDQNGTDYYILVDVSLSISKEYFSNIREALIGFPNGMRDIDTMTVITFGDQVSVVLDKAKRLDGIADTLGNLDNNDMNTHLFEAFDKTAELADREENIGRRSVAIVISDGEDCSTNENTKNAALEVLQKVGIPLYAMAVRETASGEANAFIEDFSDFVRATHGQLSVFGADEASGCIQNIQSMLNSAQVLELRARSNKLTSVMQPLTLIASGAGSEAIEVCPRYSQKDTEAPTATAEQTSDKELKIVYSESVSNADKGTSYKVTCNGEVIPVYVVNYSEGEETAAVLTFQDVLQAGEYTVEFQNIKDNSLEENPLSGNVTLNIEKETELVSELVTEQFTESVTEYTAETMQETGVWAETEAETESGTEDVEIPKKGEIPMWLIGMTAAVLILILILAVMLFCIRKRKKQPKETVPSFNQSRLKFMIHSEEGDKTIETAIQDRITLGRSSSCDVSIVDKLLSRQHFAIEKDSGFYYITDLGTTNGTMVNGIRITSRCKLKNGDVIQAGSLHITITW